ncbi:glycine cleavage system protein GcvH [Bacteroidia bacterium]|nr:glycine cleavage system protein GcvH [Bacteroidia bacterium]
MNFPENLKYTKEHEWVSIEGDTATIGVTEFAQSELGDIVFVEIETEGESFAQNEVFGTIEAVKTVSDLYMPISGEIVAVNADLEDAPESVNESPYKKGWMIKVKASNLSEIDHLMDAETYKELIGH